MGGALPHWPSLTTPTPTPLRSPTLSEIYAAVKALIVNDEICRCVTCSDKRVHSFLQFPPTHYPTPREVDALGGIDSITQWVAQHVGSEPIPAAALRPVVAPGGAAAAPEEPIAVQRGLASVPEGNEGTEGDAPEAPAAPAAEGAPSDASAPSAGAAAPALTPAERAAIVARVALAKAGFSLLRALANSDPAKVKMGSGPTLQLILQALETFREVPAVLDQAAAAISNLCLRLPDNAARAVAGGALPLIARAMRTHGASAGVQRSGCLAVRNLVVKSPARVQAAFDEGFEGLIQAAYVRHPVAGDVAYAALRDMGVPYAETSTGRAQAERAARAIATGDIAIDAVVTLR